MTSSHTLDHALPEPPADALEAEAGAGLSRSAVRGEGRAVSVAAASSQWVPVSALPAIPAKRYFTIGEVSDLCAVKPYVLRYWEQEFNQLRPMKRRGNRRYYQHHEVLLIRRIRELLYEQGFTISGARNQLADHAHGAAGLPAVPVTPVTAEAGAALAAAMALSASPAAQADVESLSAALADLHPEAAQRLREALVGIRDLLA